MDAKVAAKSSVWTLFSFMAASGSGLRLEEGKSNFRLPKLLSRKRQKVERESERESACVRERNRERERARESWRKNNRSKGRLCERGNMLV